MPGRRPPPPDPRPFGVRGRLLPLEDVPGYRDSAAQLQALAGLRPVDGKLWVLREGERPGEDRGPLIIALVLLGFGGLNLVLAVRGRRRSSRTARPVAGRTSGASEGQRAGDRVAGRERPQPARVGLGGPERERGREQEAGHSGQHGDPQRAHRSLERRAAAGVAGRSRWLPRGPGAAAPPDRCGFAGRPGAREVRRAARRRGRCRSGFPRSSRNSRSPRRVSRAWRTADGRVRKAQVAAARAAEDERPLADSEAAGRCPGRARRRGRPPGSPAATVRDHRRGTDGVPPGAPLPPGAHRIGGHPLGRRIVGVQRGGLPLVERKLARVLGILRPVLRRRSPRGSLGVGWSHAWFARVPHPSAVQ